MIVLYAKFMKNNPVVNILVNIFCFLVFCGSCYLLLYDNNLFGMVGIFPMIPIIIFLSKVSDYKRKFLHD